MRHSKNCLIHRQCGEAQQTHFVVTYFSLLLPTMLLSLVAVIDTCSCGFCHDGRRCCCCFNHAPPRSFMQPTKSTIAHTSNNPKRHRGLPPESTATHIRKIEEVKEMILHDDELTSATVIVNYCCCRRLLCVMGNDVYMGVWLLVPMWWLETARRPLLMGWRWPMLRWDWVCLCKIIRKGTRNGGEKQSWSMLLIMAFICNVPQNAKERVVTNIQ